MTQTTERLKTHELADLFPRMVDTEFQELKEDIRVRGQRTPITTKNGYVLDGRHRLRACEELGVRPWIVEYEGTDVREIMIAENLFRRSLTDDQRVALVAKLRGPRLQDEADRRMRGGTVILKSTQGPPASGRTHEILAHEARVGTHKARAAIAVAKHSTEMLQDISRRQAAPCCCG
jgi:hypothetical protein